jgi:hypothetical protein
MQALDDVPALEHEREAVASSPNGEVSNSVSVQAIVPVLAVDKESEPIVTRKELWSYYCMSLHDLPRSRERPNDSPVYYNGDNGVGPLVSRSLVPALLS